MKNKEQSSKTYCRCKTVFFILLFMFVLSLIVLFVCYKNSKFAEFYSNTVSAFFRFILSMITGFCSVSFAEIAVILFVPVMIALLVFIIIRQRHERSFLKKIGLCGCSVILLMSVLFINSFAVCYFRTPLEDNLGLRRSMPDRKQLYESSEYLDSVLSESVKNVSFSDDGSSVNPYSWSEMNRIIDEGYKSLCNDYSFISHVIAMSKRLAVSPVMTYTHISGMYFPFTGEANVNTNYPDYVVAFTVAHEKAHQRGIAGEDDANFVAFLALLYSDNDYMEYAALMTMYDYMLDSLYENDEEMYFYMLENTNKTILGEMRSYYEFFKKYSNSKASGVADNVNDTYLKTMGEQDGVESYGKVVELYCAYIESKKGLP